jgi:hypothetical protein
MSHHFKNLISNKILDEKNDQTWLVLIIYLNNNDHDNNMLDEIFAIDWYIILTEIQNWLRALK